MIKNFDYEEVIRTALNRKETFRFQELFNEVQTIKTCTPRTFNNHLKKMVKAGIVNFTPETKKEKGQYWIDSGLKTTNINLQYWLEDELNTLDKLTDTVKSILDFQSKNKNIKNKRNKSRLFEKLVNQTVDWFHLDRMLMLLLVSDTVAKMNEKLIKRTSESGLKKIGNLFEQLEQSDPTMYEEFFVKVSNKMIFQATILR